MNGHSSDVGVAIVTGAGRGAGCAIANRLVSSNGTRIVLNDLDEKSVRKVEADIGAKGGEATVVVGSVVDPKIADAMVKAALNQWGRLDILVNSATAHRDALIPLMMDDWFNLVIDVNVKGTFNCIRAATPVMRKLSESERLRGIRLHRKVVNIASTIGIYGAVGKINYAAASAAVIGMTKATARECAPHLINCNAVAIGRIDFSSDLQRADPELTVRRDLASKRMPLGRIGTCDDVAGATAFLAGPDSDFVTGAILELHGGAELE